MRRRSTTVNHMPRESTGSTRCITTLPRCVFLSCGGQAHKSAQRQGHPSIFEKPQRTFSTEISTSTLSKTPIVTFSPPAALGTVIS